MVPNKLTLVLSLFVAGVLFTGCGSTKRVESEVPKAAVAEKPKMTESAHYVVENNDTLWGIAGKDVAYSDSFQWPLIFKANRDSIKDPDLIYPKQDFTIQKGVDSADVARAKDLAMKTPKFAPHSKPRQTLPLDYF